MPPPSVKTSRPGRLLAALAVLLIVMLAGILRGGIIDPPNWHHSFKVGLGLDLSNGTTVTLQAVPPKGHSTPSQGAMTQAIQIMDSRVNGAGFNNALVQQQGSQDITVSVPGAGAQKVVGIVGKTAQLRFREVLLCSGVGVTCEPQALAGASTVTPAPGASSSPGTSPSPSAPASKSPRAKTSASPKASGGSGQAAAAARLGATSSAPATSAPATTTPSPAAAAKASPSPSAAGHASPAAVASTPPAAPTPGTPAVTGDINQVNKATLAKFAKLN
ncbi:MAG: hypothetical protein ACRDNZ_10715, partial [Streptosporangiaceae bacterium]